MTVVPEPPSETLTTEYFNLRKGHDWFSMKVSNVYSKCRNSETGYPLFNFLKAKKSVDGRLLRLVSISFYILLRDWEKNIWPKIIIKV